MFSKSRTQKLFFIFVLLVFLLGFINLFFWNTFRNDTFILLQPIFEFLKDSNLFLGICQNDRNLLIDVQNLRDENQKLFKKIKILDDLKKENNFLRKVSQIQDLKEIRKVLAKPLFYLEKDIIVLNVGEEDGIKTKMNVFNKYGFFCGWIKKTTQNFSYLKQVKFAEFELPVKIGEKEISGILVKKDNEFWIDLVPQDQEIREGDFVVSKSFLNDEVVIPENLLLGKVDLVKKNDISSFQEIKFSFGCREDEAFYFILLRDYEEI
jgi:cell shape-determining protein MreC